MTPKDQAALLEITEEAGIADLIIAIPGDYQTEMELWDMQYSEEEAARLLDSAAEKAITGESLTPDEKAILDDPTVPAHIIDPHAAETPHVTQVAPDTLARSLDAYRNQQRLSDQNMANWLGINVLQYALLRATVIPDCDRHYGNFSYIPDTWKNDLAIIAVNTGIDGFHRLRLEEILLWAFHHERGNLRAAITYWRDRLITDCTPAASAAAIKDIISEMETTL